MPSDKELVLEMLYDNNGFGQLGDRRQIGLDEIVEGERSEL